MNKFIENDTLAILLIGGITITAMFMGMNPETIVMAGLSGLIGFIG